MSRPSDVVDLRRSLEMEIAELKAQVEGLAADRDWFKRQRDDALASLATTQAVLADALAERLPPWLAGLVEHRETLAQWLKAKAFGDGDSSCCGGSTAWHYPMCLTALLLRIVVDGETQLQVNAAHEHAIDMQSPGLAGWIANLPAERDFPCNCGSALPRSLDLSMHTHNCNRARAIRWSPRAE